MGVTRTCFLASKTFRKGLLLVILMSLILTRSFCQTRPSLSHTLFLVGDCGEPYIGKEPIGSVIRKKIEASGRPKTVLFLGDNVYPKGLAPEGHRLRREGEEILNNQVRWVSGTGAATFFVPGNHDWNHWGKRGWDYVTNQQQWIDSLKDENIVLSPRDGCPGPVMVDIDEHHLLLILDTQWMLHRWEKPGESACGSKSVDDVLRRISGVFEQNSHKRIIVAAHHPLITYGEHGGVFSLRSHIFPLVDLSKYLYIPLPLIGSIYPLYRKWFGHIQDTAHRSYRKFAQAILAIMARHPGSIFVAGHEHALQYIVKDGVHVIVSGTGAKTGHARKKKYAVLATGVRGFVQVSTFVDGSVSLHFFQVDDEHPEGNEIFTQGLRQIHQDR